MSNDNKEAQECRANAAVYEGCGASLGFLREVNPIFYHCDLRNTKEEVI